MDFSDKIPSSLVCDWFYSFFIVYVVLTGLIFLALLYVLFFTKASFIKTLFSMRFFTALLGLVFSGTNTLFFYVICKRSLKPESA